MQPSISPATTRIGWIGTGVMGSSMCGHLIRAGYQASVFNRTAAKAKGLTEAGAKLCSSPKEVAENSDVVFSIVGFPDDVRATYLGKQGVLAGCRADMIVVDMTTSQPKLAEEIYATAKDLQVAAVDAPVSGGDIGAREARLSIMIGGDHETFEQLSPLWEKMGKTIVYQGAAGAGQHTKMMNQILIAGNMVGVCEAMLYAYRAGLDIEKVMQSVTTGAAGSWSLSNLGPRMIKNDFAPGFMVDHFVKDMGIALEEAKSMHLSLPGLALAHQLYIALQAQGGGHRGTQALVAALARVSQLDWEKRS